MWHNYLTLDNCQDIEGVPKNCLKILFQNEYNSYSNAFALRGLKSLSEKKWDVFKFCKSMCETQPNKSHVSAKI